MDKTAKVWDAAGGTGGKLLLTLNVQSDVGSVTFSPDGQRIVTGSDLPAMVWDAASGKHLTTLQGNARLAAWQRQQTPAHHK